MLGILKQLEASAPQLHAVVLIGFGVTALWIGLVVWLIGVTWPKRVGALVAGLTGAGTAGLVFGPSLLWVGLCAAVPVVVAVLLRRLVAAILSGFLAGVIVLLVLAGPALMRADRPPLVDSQHAVNAELTIPQSLSVLRTCAVDFGDHVKEVASGFSLGRWAAILGLGIVVAFAGLLLWRQALAVSFAIVGSVLLFVGTGFLLLYKGAMPVASVLDQWAFFALLFLCMVGFGTMVQWFLGRYVRSHSVRPVETEPEHHPEERTELTWRNR